MPFTKFIRQNISPSPVLTAQFQINGADLTKALVGAGNGVIFKKLNPNTQILSCSVTPTKGAQGGREVQIFLTTDLENSDANSEYSLATLGVSGTTGTMTQAEVEDVTVGILNQDTYIGVRTIANKTTVSAHELNITVTYSELGRRSNLFSATH